MKTLTETSIIAQAMQWHWHEIPQGWLPGKGLHCVTSLEHEMSLNSLHEPLVPKAAAAPPES